MMQDRLLGFAPLAHLDALTDRLAEVPGPKVNVWRGPGIAALSQAELGGGLFGGHGATTSDLLSVQRRLEVACQAGPFLPQDPSAALIAADAIPALLAPQWRQLADALDGVGHHHQWDIVLQWSPESVVARHAESLTGAASRTELAEAVKRLLQTERDRQQARLLAVLAPAVRAFAAGGPTGAETQVAVTVQIHANTEAALETALESLDDPALAIDLRGPLPPISFSAVRIATVTQTEIESAWRTLALTGRVDKSDLHRQWRTLAAAVHPDRGVAAAGIGPDVAQLTHAYQQLRRILPVDGAPAALDDLLRMAVPRLVLPEQQSIWNPGEPGAAVPPQAAMLQAAAPAIAPAEALVS